MTRELRSAFDKVYLTIDVDNANRWVSVNWIGYLSEDNIKTGAIAYTEALKSAGYKCVLNDTRQIIGGWNHSLEWVLNDWAPRAAKAGLQHFAMITNPESFGGSTASKFYDSLTNFKAQVFDDKTKAENWLKQYSLF